MDEGCGGIAAVGGVPHNHATGSAVAFGGGVGRWGGTPPYDLADHGAQDEDGDEREGEAQREGPRRHVEPRRPARRDEV